MWINKYLSVFCLKFTTDKELSEELRKLQKMRQAETFSRMKDSNTDNEELCMSGGDEVSGEAGNSARRRDTNKRKRHSGSETGDMDMPSRIHEDSVLRIESAKDLHKETMHRECLVISRKVLSISSEIFSQKKKRKKKRVPYLEQILIVFSFTD